MTRTRRVSQDRQGDLTSVFRVRKSSHGTVESKGKTSRERQEFNHTGVSTLSARAGKENRVEAAEEATPHRKRDRNSSRREKQSACEELSGEGPGTGITASNRTRRTGKRPFDISEENSRADHAPREAEKPRAKKKSKGDTKVKADAAPMKKRQYLDEIMHEGELFKVRTMHVYPLPLLCLLFCGRSGCLDRNDGKQQS